MVIPSVVMFAIASTLGAVVVTAAPQSCPSVCKCRWKAGKETIECQNKRLQSIPRELSAGTQVLDLSHNSLGSLGQEVFSHAGLTHLQKLSLADCKLRMIDDSAFRQLSNLVELDLSNNLLIAVPSETFVDYPGLRRLNLNGNIIRRIESAAFVRLPYLDFLELSNCHIVYVGPRAFSGLSVLHQLKLNGNELATLPPDADIPLRSLYSVDLFDNPWHCDCQLRPLRDWLYNGTLPINNPPTCTEPPRVSGVPLVQVAASEFACPPTASWGNSNNGVVVSAEDGEDARIPCRVSADPEARVTWTALGRHIVNLTRFSRGGRSQMYIIHEKGSVEKVNVLTITSAGPDDMGEYLCTANNAAGTLVLNFTLDILPAGLRGNAGLGSGNLASIGTALACIGLVGLVILVALVWRARIRHRRRQQTDEHKPFGGNEDSKKEHVHLVNHVKFDVGREKLELGTENALYKPLCSVGETLSNEAFSSVVDGEVCDGIGGGGGGGNKECENSTIGCYQQYRAMSRSNSCGGAAPSINRPDVVNVGKNATQITSPEGGGRECQSGSGYMEHGSWAGRGDANAEVFHDRSSVSHLATLPRKNGGRTLPRVTMAISSSGDPYSRSRVQRCEIVDVNNMDGRSEFPAIQDPWNRTQRPHRANNDPENEVCGSGDNVCVDNSEEHQRVLPTPGCPRYFNNHEPNGKPPDGEDWTQRLAAGRGSVVGIRNGRGKGRPPIPPKRYGSTSMNIIQNPAVGGGSLNHVKHSALLARHFVPVLPPLPAHHFAQARDSPDEGYEDEVLEEGDNL